METEPHRELPIETMYQVIMTTLRQGGGRFCLLQLEIEGAVRIDIIGLERNMWPASEAQGTDPRVGEQRNHKEFTSELVCRALEKRPQRPSKQDNIIVHEGMSGWPGKPIAGPLAAQDTFGTIIYERRWWPSSPV